MYLAKQVTWILVLGLALPGFVLHALGQTPSREHFQNADVLYDWVSNHRNEKLRTFITQPKSAAGKVDETASALVL
jgi:hypothetical protein